MSEFNKSKASSTLPYKYVVTIVFTYTKNYIYQDQGV